MKFLPRWFIAFAILPCWAFAQTTLNLSQDLVRLGIATANMTPNQPSLDSGPLLQQGVTYANKNKIPSVIADPGAYYFLSLGASDRYIALSGVTGVTIDFQGSDLYFANPLHSGLGLAVGKNVTVQNFTVDYLQMLYTQVQVTAVNSTTRTIQFTISPNWQNLTALNALAGSNLPAYLFIYRSGRPWSVYGRMPIQQPLNDTSLVVTTTDPDLTPAIIAQVQTGDVGVVMVRGGGSGVIVNGGSLAGCSGCTFHNVKIYSGFVGFSIDGAQSCTLDHVYVMPKPGTDRLVSTMADGITATQVGLNNTLRLNRSIRTLDDAISPHTWVFGSVQSAPTGTTNVLQVQGDANTALAANGYYTLPNGSNVVFQRPSDGAILGSAVVSSQASAPAVNNLPQVLLTFNGSLPSGLTGSYLYAVDPSWRAGNLFLDRNAVEQQGWARGISLWGLMNATLTGNYIHNSNMAGIDMQHQLATADWIVPPTINATIKNNVLDGTVLVPAGQNNLIQLAGIQALGLGTNFTPMSNSPNQGIAVTNNFVAQPGRAAVWIGNAASGSVSENYFLNPNNNPSISTAYPAFQSQESQPVVVETSPGVTTSNNTIDSFSSVVFVSDTQSRELAAYSPGSVVRLNAYNVGKLAQPTVTLTDSSGATTAATVQATATHSIDLQLPASAALGGAYLTLNAGGGQYFGTLFLDSADNIAAVNGCTYELSPSTTSVAAGASSVAVLVFTQSGCAFKATDGDSFVTLTATGSGPGIVTAALAANTGAQRTTTTAVAGQSITLTQAGVNNPQVAGVVSASAFGGFSTIGAGSWIEIYGSNLAGSSRGWSGSDFSGVNAPTSLSGTSVTIGGQPAFVAYISAGQVNVQAPATVTAGAQQIIVTSPSGVSAPFTVNTAAASPGVLAPGSFQVNGKQYVVAFFPDNVTYVLPSGAIPGLASRPAKPGDTIVIYGVGFGSVTPNIPPGQLVQGANSVSANVQVQFGNTPATLVYSGLSPNLVGVYQFNVVVPNVPGGDAIPLTFTYNGAPVNQQLYIAVQN